MNLRLEFGNNWWVQKDVKKERIRNAKGLIKRVGMQEAEIIVKNRTYSKKGCGGGRYYNDWWLRAGIAEDCGRSRRQGHGRCLPRGPYRERRRFQLPHYLTGEISCSFLGT